MNQPYPQQGYDQQQYPPQQQYVPQQQQFPQQQVVPMVQQQPMQPAAEPVWVREPLLPPPHIQYAHRLGRGMLTLDQVDELVSAINQAYVMKKQNNSYLSQHQARAEMNRLFGYGNWDEHVEEMYLEYEERLEAGHPSFPKKPNADVYWISCYRARVRVDIRDMWGMPIASYSEYHVEENAPQPNRGEARALAATSVESYALRRALINLGDRLGLGLYNKGSMAAHGQYTIQQKPGILFQWVDQNTKRVAAESPVELITHQTIKAERSVADDVEPGNYEQPQEQPQQPAQQPIQQGGMNEFHQAQQTLQQGREEYRANAMAQQQIDPAMQARLQAGFKTDPQGGQQ